MKFEIPATMDAAEDEAGRLGEEVSTNEWARAAIVYARGYVLPGKGRPSKNLKLELSASGKVSPTAYASKGIHGLRSPQTVVKYREAWVRAMEELGWESDVHLGDKVDLPEDLEWADYYSPPQFIEQRQYVDDPIKEPKTSQPSQPSQ